MVPTFPRVDREEDYRVAWKFFKERVKAEEHEEQQKLAEEITNED